MTTKTQLQHRLALLLADAKELGLNPHEILPLEPQVPALSVDGNATSRIYKLEGLIDEKDEQIAALTSELGRAQQRIETIEIPADLKQFQAELDQANRNVDFYRNLSNDSEKRAMQYREKMKEALKKLALVEEVDKKIKRLEMENCDLRQSKGRIADELHGMEEIYEKLQGKYSAALEEHEKQYLSFRSQIAEHASENHELSRGNREIEEQYQEVLTSMDDVMINTMANFNASQEQVRSTQEKFIATLSELKPLHRFYVKIADLLRVYDNLFKQLLSATEQNVHFRSDLGEDISTRLHESEDECQAFHTIRATFRSSGLHQDEDYDRLDGLANSAEEIQKSMSSIGKDVTQFLWALRYRPDAWQLIRHKFRLSN